MMKKMLVLALAVLNAASGFIARNSLRAAPTCASYRRRATA